MNGHPRRVVITGSECVGKTTLVAALASHYGVPGTTEFVRAYVKGRPGPIEVADHSAIAAGQVSLEDRALRLAIREGHRLLLLDTDLLSTVAYAHVYTGGCDPSIEQVARERVADAYLLLDIDVPWVPDDVRDQPDRRAEVHATFVRTLTRFQAPFQLVGGAWDQRFLQATQAIDRLLSS